MRNISLKRILRIGLLAAGLVLVAAAAPGAQQAPASKTGKNAGAKPAAKAAKTIHNEAKPDKVPVTTSSKEARHDYELGMLHREDLLFDEEGLNDFRRAVKADPNFALAHATIAFFSDDPREEKHEILLAKQTLAHAAADEKLLIRWMIGTKDGDLIPAISAMNDLMASYPRDARLGNMYGEWLLAVQLNYERAEEVLQHVLKVDPNYFPALNNLGVLLLVERGLQQDAEADGTVRGAIAGTAESAGFLRRTAAHGGGFQGFDRALPRGAVHFAEFHYVAARHRFELCFLGR